MLRMVLKEKALVEEENFQDSKKRRKEEKNPVSTVVECRGIGCFISLS